jgi:hypothetical protein
MPVVCGSRIVANRALSSGSSASGDLGRDLPGAVCPSAPRRRPGVAARRGQPNGGLRRTRSTPRSIFERSTNVRGRLRGSQVRRVRGSAGTVGPVAGAGTDASTGQQPNRSGRRDRHRGDVSRGRRSRGEGGRRPTDAVHPRGKRGRRAIMPGEPPAVERHRGMAWLAVGRHSLEIDEPPIRRAVLPTAVALVMVIAIAREAAGGDELPGPTADGPCCTHGRHGEGGSPWTTHAP